LLATDVAWDRDSQTDFLETILDESEKLQELVDQLLEASRLEAGRFDVNLEPVTFSTIVSVARAQLEVLTRQHELTVDAPDDVPNVLADVRRIAQVLTNLVKNSTQHSAPDSLIVIAAHEKDG